MLAEICAYLRNWFCDPGDRHIGTFEISDGELTPSDFLQDGQYFRVIGSIFNDGVYSFPSAELHDETFDGAVWAMRIPRQLIELDNEITQYVHNLQSKISEEGWDMFSSQSFKGYSGTVRDFVEMSWKKKYGPQLAQWRKL